MRKSLPICAAVCLAAITVFPAVPVVIAEEATTQPAEAAGTFNHGLLDRVLRVSVDKDGWVDYARVLQHRSIMQQYVSTLAKADLSKLSKDEQLALYINAYNAFTLQLIGEYWKDGRLESIMDIPEDRRWDHVRWTIGGRKYSLNQIEHEIIRKQFDEPRIHFALVCAAYSCPKLLDRAYTGAKLDEQLEAQTKYAHEQLRWFKWDPKNNTIHVTKLYDWYGEDFVKDAGSVAVYVARYVPRVREKIDSGETPTVKFLDYDWRLNDKKNKPAP